VVHRDIKPSNIVVTQDNRIKVVDFGIAKIESSDLTQVGTMLGTPTYMSPEQFMGHTADPRSDIYSAGVILYQFLTGEKPFTGSMAAIMHKVLSQAPVPPSTLNPSVHKVMEEVVRKAMAKSPEDRFQNAAEFMQALEAAVHAPPAYKPPPLNEGDATMLSTHNKPAPQPAAEAENFDFATLLADVKNQTVNSPAANAVPGAPTPAEMSERTRSRLLDGLAREAEATLGSRAMTDKHLDPEQRLHAALDSTLKFFTTYAQHLHDAAPAINRTYRFDRNDRMSAYSGLTCQKATTDFRKRDLSDAALLDSVTFNMHLRTSAQVVVSRMVNELPALKEQLQLLKVRSLDGLEADGRQSSQDWLKIRLAPDFLLQLKFKGNYTEKTIHVYALNLEGFGQTEFRLDPLQVTPDFLDEIGLFLLGRADRLPQALRHI
jgi:hypothetical protein